MSRFLRLDCFGFRPGGIFEEASRRIVHNILKSYTGYFDVFSELLQNSLDAIQSRERLQEPGYQPTIWISLDLQSRTVRVVDNGIGMDEQEFKFCLRPNVSFKRQADLRGHKGVGATFLAYGFSFAKLQTRKSGSSLGAILRQGRQWAEDVNASTIGYQANSHVIVHFSDGDPDMGRKTFQPELTELAEVLAVRAVNTMKRRCFIS